MSWPPEGGFFVPEKRQVAVKWQQKFSALPMGLTSLFLAHKPHPNPLDMNVFSRFAFSPCLTITVYPDVYQEPLVVPSSQNAMVLITRNSASYFLKSVEGLIAASLLSMIQVQIGINGTIKPPAPEPSLVYGNTYAYFSASASQMQMKHMLALIENSILAYPLYAI